jgi:hypothetical protein
MLGSTPPVILAVAGHPEAHDAYLRGRHFWLTSDHEHVRHAYCGNGARLRALQRRFNPDSVFASAIPLPD